MTAVKHVSRWSAPVMCPSETNYLKVRCCQMQQEGTVPAYVWGLREQILSQWLGELTCMFMTFRQQLPLDSDSCHPCRTLIDTFSVYRLLLRKWPQPVRMMCENNLWLWFISEKQSTADDKISLFNLNLMAKKCDTRRPFWLYSGPLLLSAARTRRGSFGQQGLNTSTPAIQRT